MILEPAVNERGSVKRAVGEFEGFDGDFDGVLDGHVTSDGGTIGGGSGGGAVAGGRPPPKIRSERSPHGRRFRRRQLYGDEFSRKLASVFVSHFSFCPEA